MCSLWRICWGSSSLRASPNLADRKLYAFGSASEWPALAPFIAGRPDEKLIAAQWDDVLRLTTSVRTGTVRASLMLKRLGAYPRQNGLALALREIGRIERTLYALDWLEQPDLRRQATAELNKGESHNALSRAVCFHRLGRLHDRTAQSQQHRASGLALVTAAIVLWNTVYPRPGTGCRPPQRRPDPGCPARPPRPIGLAAHQPHRGLPLERQHQPRTGRVQASAWHHSRIARDHGSMILFTVRATNRAILPVLWRTPKPAL